MAIQVGDVVYIDYGEIPRVVHTRVILAVVDASLHDYVVLTPDHDVYTERLDVATNSDLAHFYNGGPNGGLPRGVPRNCIYAFAPMSAQELARFMAAGRQEAEAEIGRRGVAVGRIPVVPGGGAPVGGEGGDPGVAQGAGNDDGMLWVLAEMVEGRKIGEPVSPPADAPRLDSYALMTLSDDKGKARPVLICKVDPNKLAEFCDERIKLARASEAADGDDLFASEDVRTMEISYNANGERSKSFKEAIGEMIQVSFDDFPLEPRTCLEYLRAVGSIAESCYGQHLAWVQQAKIPDSNRAIHEDELLARVLDTCITYDCLNAANLGCMELVVRRRQLIAQAHALNPASPSYDGADLFLGNQYRAGGGIVVPALKEHVSKGLQAESQILKERRKLAEARGSGSGKGGGGPGKSDGKGRGTGQATSWGQCWGVGFGTGALLPSVALLVWVMSWSSPVFHEPGTGDGRQRDVFPLPLLSNEAPVAGKVCRSVRQRLWKKHGKMLVVNKAIHALRIHYFMVGPRSSRQWRLNVCLRCLKFRDALSRTSWSASMSWGRLFLQAAQKPLRCFEHRCRHPIWMVMMWTPDLLCPWNLIPCLCPQVRWEGSTWLVLFLVQFVRWWWTLKTSC